MAILAVMILLEALMPTLRAQQAEANKAGASHMVLLVFCLMLGMNLVLVVYVAAVEMRHRREGKYLAVSDDEFQFDTVDVNGKLEVGSDRDMQDLDLQPAKQAGMEVS